jgi:hypothetical protein
MMADASYTLNADSLALVVRAFLSLGQHQDAYQTLKRHSTLAQTVDHSQASDIFTDTVEQLKIKASFHWSLVDIVLFCLQTRPKAVNQDGTVSEVVHVCLARGRTKLAFDVSPTHPHAAVTHVNVCQLCLWGSATVHTVQLMLMILNPHCDSQGCMLTSLSQTTLFCACTGVMRSLVVIPDICMF